ncbi:PREDICTED: GTPase Era, mitochondrial [Dinoponera quadriceps]|uniref:GTPase Era, mitochondrial n=1 Tax=Dinoponera quadriceps TaxID=609295 RepID=A0A6P3XTE9_DINQU|nr:PREDICTED: GTPase Era, mitochondrial [Dinoponera quadriceps]
MPITEMLFTIEKYAIRLSSRFLRRCFSKNVDVLSTDAEELMLHRNHNFISVSREDEKCLNIAILGAPNVGKSTLVNQLIKRSVCAISCKVHTTQAKADAIYSENNTQLIFMDTPGMVSPGELKRFKLAKSFERDPNASLKTADIIGLVQDVDNTFARDKINPNIFKLLKNMEDKIPMILIFNKVDRLKKKNTLLDLAKVLTKSKNSLKFTDVFMISALTGDGVDDLRTYLLDSAKPRKWHYEEHIYSNQTCEDIIQQTVRAKLLDNLPQEMPYNMQVKLEHFDPGPDDSVSTLVSVTCPNKRICSILFRRKGERLRNIALMAEQELRHAFRTPVKLKINVQSAT